MPTQFLNITIVFTEKGICVIVFIQTKVTFNHIVEIAMRKWKVERILGKKFSFLVQKQIKNQNNHPSTPISLLWKSLVLLIK